MLPPSVIGAVKATDKVWDADGVTVEIAGAPAVVDGVALKTTLASPGPFELTARIETPYEVPFTRPGMTSGEPVEAGLRVVHVAPESVEYW